VFELDFDYLVTPLAYDMQLVFRPAFGFRIVDVYGVPTWTPGEDLVDLEVATLFLSRNHGAILVRLEPVSPRHF
jgi:Ca-activated chloride channel family protein